MVLFKLFVLNMSLYNTVINCYECEVLFSIMVLNFPVEPFNEIR